ncbi:hypothetical protein HDU79_010914 [Rhizoclosmatium sp. JEL0117]|nr:hypothetical protein HDU79_010914 [Rhizoclosmatium sp. JEL0117]
MPADICHEAQVAIEQETSLIDQITHVIIESTHQISAAILHTDQVSGSSNQISATEEKNRELLTHFSFAE